MAWDLIYMRSTCYDVLPEHAVPGRRLQLMCELRDDMTCCHVQAHNWCMPGIESAPMHMLSRSLVLVSWRSVALEIASSRLMTSCLPSLRATRDQT